MMEAERHPTDYALDGDSILGIDNIALNLPLAGIGSRTLAAAIDFAILTIVIPLALLLVVSTGSVGLDGPWQIALLFVLVFALYWGYFLFQELLFSGRTVGKMAVHLRVVGRQGGSASWSQLVLRNLLRPVDMMVGVPLMMVDELSRRLGDRVGGTLVVHDRPQETHEITLGRIPADWDARRVALAEALFRRAPGMDPLRVRTLALRLVDLVRRDDPALLEGAPPAETDPLATLRYALAVGHEK